MQIVIKKRQKKGRKVKMFEAVITPQFYYNSRTKYCDTSKVNIEIPNNF